MRKWKNDDLGEIKVSDTFNSLDRRNFLKTMAAVGMGSVLASVVDANKPCSKSDITERKMMS
jgi:hypothetical protein